MTSATDNRTTELREKLDELSIEHFDYDKGGRTQTQWEAPDGKRHFTYETAANPAKTARLTISWFPTPKQAIAATLGNGKLTAEQVRDFLNRHSIFDDTTWPHGRQELVFDEDDLQAMADELNAKFGRGTCHDVWQDDPFANFKCSECNGELHYRDKRRIACCSFCKREVVSA